MPIWEYPALLYQSNTYEMSVGAEAHTS